MRQRELLDFRTPQHPSLGTNHWGGASPLLARNVPKESLEQRYLNLNAIRTRDEIFSTLDHEFFKSSPPQAEAPPTPTPSRRGILLKLIWPRKENGATLGSPKKKKWFPKWDPKKRWPQGWC